MSLLLQFYILITLQFSNEIFFLDKPNIYGQLDNWLPKLSRNIIQFHYQPFLLSF